LSAYRRFWFGNASETDSVSLLGGNTLGGKLAQPEKWFAWAIDYSVASAAPPLDLTGREFSEDWALRKVNNLNKNLAGGIATTIMNIPWVAGKIIQVGQAIHRNPRLWVAATIITAGIPIIVNYKFMKMSGAWTYD